MDFMYDKEGNPYLLEMNMNPALFCDTDVQTKVIPPMMKEVIGIVLQENKDMFKDKQGSIKFNDVYGNAHLDQTKCGWDVVIDEKNNVYCADM